MVRAKFKVNKIESTEHMTRVDGEGTRERPYKYITVELRTIVMAPVYANGDPEHENSKFWQASPIGELRLGTINPGAWKHFELGGEYYVDFTKAGE